MILFVVATKIVISFKHAKYFEIKNPRRVATSGDV